VTHGWDKISQQPENCENRNDPDLVQAFLKKWWVESDFKAPIVVNSYTILGFAFHCLGFKHIYSQLHINGIQQQTTPIQAISFLLRFSQFSGC
jgi:hypothetical protein